MAGEETEAAKAGHSSCLVELGPGSSVAHCGGWMEQGQPQWSGCDIRPPSDPDPTAPVGAALFLFPQLSGNASLARWRENKAFIGVFLLPGCSADVLPLHSSRPGAVMTYFPSFASPAFSKPLPSGPISHRAVTQFDNSQTSGLRNDVSSHPHSGN